MGKIMSVDGPVMVFLRKITDLIILSLLWLVCCLPVITFGVSTTALYYVTLKMARKEDSQIVKMFFKAFRENIKQGMILSLLFICVGAFLCFEFLIITTMEGFLCSVLLPVFVAIVAIYLSVILYAFPLQAQFINTVGGTIKNALILSVQSLPRTILMLVITLLPGLLLVVSPNAFYITLPMWIFFAPAANSYLCSKQFIKIFSPVLRRIEGETSKVETES